MRQHDDDQEHEKDARAKRLAKINAIYDAGGDWRKTLLETLPIDVEMVKREKPRVGLVSYNKSEARGDEGFGLAAGDSLFQVHIEPAYLHPEESLTSESVKRAFGALAEFIVDHCPEAKAVYGRSWLMSHPLAKRLGFVPSEKVVEDMETPSFWSQFLDKEGLLDRRKVDGLLRANEPQFPVRKGYMNIDDFLRRYLPKERRGDVVLKEQDSSWYEQYEKPMAQERERMLREWNRTTLADLPSRLHILMPTLMEFVDKAGVTDRFVSLLSTAKANGVSWSNTLGSREALEVGKVVRATVDAKRLRDRTVHID